MNCVENYWIGPYGVRVSADIESVIDIDDVSLIRKDGTKIKIEKCYGFDSKGELTRTNLIESEYKYKYAYFDLSNNQYYYNNPQPKPKLEPSTAFECSII